MRRLSVALIEQADFSSGTSANCFKIIHGGLRYLQHLDVRRMRQSIRERTMWLRTAPHLIETLPIVVPTYGHGLRSRSLLRSALVVNDLVSWDRNRLLSSDRRLPAGRALSRRECLNFVPELSGPGLTGAVMFHDAQMYSAERVVLENVLAAHEAGAAAANYVEFEQPVRERGRIVGGRVRDRLGGDVFDVRATVIVNAAGPAAPMIANRLTGGPSSVTTRYSMALNFLVPHLGHGVAFTVAGHRRDPTAVVHRGARQLFVVPWRGHSAIGTAHYAFQGDPAQFLPDERSVETFLAEVNAAWPGKAFERNDLALVHSGLLPVANRATDSDIALLKHHQIVDHVRDAAPEAISAISVKYTTGRLVAEQAVDLVVRKLGRDKSPSETSDTPLPGAPVVGVAELVRQAVDRWGDELDSEVIEHLVRSYGSRYERVLACRRADPEWDRRVDPGAPVIKAQLTYGVQHEMACTPEDLLARRTELGARGITSPATRAMAAEVLAVAAVPHTEGPRPASETVEGRRPAY